MDAVSDVALIVSEKALSTSKHIFHSLHHYSSTILVKPFVWSIHLHYNITAGSLAAFIAVSAFAIRALLGEKQGPLPIYVNRCEERGRRAKKEMREFVEGALERLKGRHGVEVVEAALGEKLTDSHRSSFEELRLGLLNNTLSAETLLLTLIRRAHAAHMHTNCLTSFIKSCVSTSVERDLTAKESRGPLHGVPISLKENVIVAGEDATAGVGKLCDVIYGDYALFVKALMDAGAVPMCRTNLPQTMLSYGCSNPIFGNTVNPYNTSRTCGGSSGGEAALIASGGSIVGIGTDVGGSVRVPAAFCGVCGFRPTSGRLSRHGVYPPSGQMVGVASSAGIMGIDVGAVAACFRVLYSEYMWKYDSTVIPMKFDESLYSSAKPLKIGYYVSDGFFPAIPACARAVREACRRLESRGHTVVKFDPPDVPEGMKLFFKLLTADGGKGLQDLLKGEILDVSVQGFSDSLKKAGSLYDKTWVSYNLRKIKKWPRIADVHDQLPECTVPELWAAQSQRMDYLRKYVAAVKAAGIDAFVTPQHVMLAPAFDHVARTGMTLCYTQIFNVLDFPAGVVPVTTATESDQAAMAEWPMSTMREQHGDDVERLVAQGKIYGQQDDPIEQTVRANMSSGVVGLPVCVQCVSLPWKDEVAMRVMREVELGK